MSLKVIIHVGIVYLNLGSICASSLDRTKLKTTQDKTETLALFTLPPQMKTFTPISRSCKIKTEIISNTLTVILILTVSKNRIHFTYLDLKN